MTVEQFLTNLGEKSVHFIDNQGNAGDGLIHAGFYDMAKRLGLTLESFNYPEERTGKVLLIMGAGAFCQSSWHQVDKVNFYCTRFEKVCVLPATFEWTYRPVKKMLQELAPNVTVFCRERISYDAALKLVPRPEHVHLDHDLAFSLDPSPWTRKGLGELMAFRTDAESRYRMVPTPNFDISDMGREHHFELLPDIISNFETIWTDRLHVSIAGAVLGRKVNLFEGSYHKIRGVYEYSLKDRYPNVKLCGKAELQALMKISNAARRKFAAYKVVRRLPGAESILRTVRAHKKAAAR